MKRALLAAALSASVFASVATLTGCNKDSGGTSIATSGGTAVTGVVDLHKVADDLGWLTQLKTNTDTYRAQLQKQLDAAKSQYQKDLDNIVNQIIPDKTKVTKEQADAAQQIANYANQLIRAIDQKGGQMIAEYQQKSANEFQRVLSPVIRKVAQDKKISILLAKTDVILYSDAAIDLTNSVVDAATRDKPVPAAQPMPALQLDEHIPLKVTTQPAATQPTTQP